MPIGSPLKTKDALGGRRSTDHSAYLRFSRKLTEAELTRFIAVDEIGGLFSFGEKADAIKAAESLDGKLVLRTNVKDLDAEQNVKTYKALADIERTRVQQLSA